MPLTPLEDDPRVPLYYQYESAEDCFACEFDNEDVELRQPYAAVMTFVGRGEIGERHSLSSLKFSTNLVCEDDYSMTEIQKAITKLVEFGIVTQHHESNEFELHDSERTRLLREKVM